TYLTMGFDKDPYGNDELAYAETANYKESDNSLKSVTTKSWFNGAGQVLRTGTATSSALNSFDMVATVYNDMGRVLRQWNPYYSSVSDGTGSTLYYNEYTYDKLGRVTQVALWNNAHTSSTTMQTISYGVTLIGPTTAFAVKVTDQVNRQRQSETDGLGNLVTVIEQDPNTQT